MDWQTVWYEDRERQTGRQRDRQSPGWCFCISPSSSAGFDSVWSCPFSRWVLLSLVRLFSRFFFFRSCQDKMSLIFLIYLICKEKTNTALFLFSLIISWNPLAVSIFQDLKAYFDITVVWAEVKEIDISDLQLREQTGGMWLFNY